MEEKTRIATVGRMALFRDGEGLGVEPVDPRQDLAMSLRFIRWAIGVGLWLAGWIADRRKVDEVVLEKVITRARREGRITVY